MRQGLAQIATARTALARGYGGIGEVGPLWGQLVEGTRDPSTAQLPALADIVVAGIGECHAAITRAEQLLTGYLKALGADASPPAGASATAVPEPPVSSDRIPQAQQRVGTSRTAGSQARGEWVRSDGW
ncbi:hypothetical protein D5S19_25205 [Amycolatopsis panacis]|uniref:Uncharacterized protein n=1 Tax=Amycolatopsis panacis TaxID=2340917 RepID=A0A419HTJ8_9PSEU|nr:hypothetical protein D5S19_25205 [Amycolatopsis panacis]